MTPAAVRDHPTVTTCDRSGADVPTAPSDGGVLPGAEPVDLPGGPVGALLCHGFTGTTQSMRPWAEHLAAAGLTVSAPRLPGHGTRWQDMNRTRFSDWYGELERSFDDLRARCESVFVMGLSMGGTLSLRLAEQRAAEVAGVVVVNASLASERKDVKLAPYSPRSCRRCPASPATSRSRASPSWRTTRCRCARWSRCRRRGRSSCGTCTGSPRRCSSTAARSTTSSSRSAGGCCSRAWSHGTVEERVLEDSYHVATLDNDAPEIFAGSLDFVRTHAPAAAG